MINGFDFVFFSELTLLEQNVYYVKCFRFVRKLRWEYPDFENWFNNLFQQSPCLRPEREILFCRINQEVVGIAILKKTPEEQKICTLRVDKRYQRMSIGKNLMELSFEWLGNDKPLITVHKSKQREFERLFQYYGFELDDQKWGYYWMFRTELAYNGELPSRELRLNRFEIADMHEVIAEFIQRGVYDTEQMYRRCIELWTERNLYFEYRLLNGLYL